MRHWTRGEKIGCWSMVVGTVTCLAVLSSVPPFQGVLPRLFHEAPAQSTSEAAHTQGQIEVLEQERKLLDEQTRAMREEARSLYEERVRARSERIDGIAERYRRGKQREYDRIVFENKCPADVAVAVYYLDLDEKWITRGWWQVPSGESMTTDAMTRNRYLYLYAENKGLGRTWDGAGKPDAVELSISDSKFDHVKGERFLYEKPRSVSFFRRDTGESWTDFKEVFECLAEAPEAASAREPGR
jgi:uncharacterized membrane protein